MAITGKSDLFSLPKGMSKAIQLVERAEQRTHSKPNHRNMTAQGRATMALVEHWCPLQEGDCIGAHLL